LRDSITQKLCEKWQIGSPELAIQAAIGAAFPDLSQAQIPIAIRDLAKLRNVMRISTRKLDCDGIISRNDSGQYLIDVNQDHSKQRQRFTIAHEIGHTFFFELPEYQNKSQFRLRDENLGIAGRPSSEEYLCNYAASELLMPYRQFSTLIRESGPSSAGLIRMARSFDVSLQACARRTVQVLPFNLVIVLWEYQAMDFAVIRESSLRQART
jgi:predicted transcriptional regulator